MQSKQGYTLIELMLVIACIAILSIIGIQKFGSLISRAKDATTLGNLATLREAVALYYTDHGGMYPRFPPPTNQPAGYGSLLTDALVPSYIANIPQAMPSGNHHKSSNLIGLFYNFTGNADDEANGYGAGWEYDANPFDINGTGGFSGFGSVRVMCKHKDSHGHPWSVY